MRLFRGTKGGVSIFLTIILVPVVAICTLFIDVSRVYLSTDLAASSADLSLNTVMSQYDVDLEQYYGLMASCQNIDEFYDVAEEYFAACMRSNGVAATDSQKWAQQLRNILGGNVTYDDLIRIDQSSTSAEIENLENANMANAAMVKEQVTEFMKYRGPVDLINEAAGLNYKGIYTKFKKIGEQAKNLPYEADVQDKKTKYYTAENELLQKSLEAYELLENYEALEVDNDYMAGTMNCYKELKPEFTKLHEDYVEKWANIEWIWTDMGMKKVSDLIVGAMDSASTYSEPTVDGEALQTLIKAVYTAKDDFEKKRNEVIAKFNENDYCDLESPAVSKYQYWIHIEHILSYGSGSYTYNNSLYKEYVDSYRKLMAAIRSLENGYEYRVGGEKDDNEDHTDVGQEAYTSEQTYEGAYNQAESDYTSAVSHDDAARIEKITSRAQDYYDSTSGEMTEANANSKILPKVMATAKGEPIGSVNKDTEKLKEKYERIHEANKRILALKKKIDEIVDDDLADEYHNAYETWKEKVGDANSAGIKSEVIKHSEEEIAEIEKTDNSLDTKMDPKNNVNVDVSTQDFKDFSATLQNISDLFESYMDVAESIKYHGACILGTDLTDRADNGARGIKGLEMFDNAAKTAGTSEKNVKNDDIPVKTDELNTYKSETTWEFDESPIETLIPVTDDNSPCHHNSTSYTDETSKRKIDKFLHRQFDEMEIKDERSKKTKGMIDTLKELVKNPLPDDWEDYENIHNSANEINGESDLPSKTDSEVSEDTDPLVGGLEKKDDVTEETESTLTMANALQEIVAIIEDVALGARDNLYTTDYIMNMFSYETHYMETVYGQTRANMEDSGAKSENIYNVGLSEPIKPGNAKNLYDTESAWNIMKDPDLTKTYNKSLTNRIINKMEGDANDGIPASDPSKGSISQAFAGNNWSYGNEVEYILSGSDNKTNKDRIEAVLYFIRYAFNFAPVFENYWNDKVFVIPVSNLIAEATAGVIPPPLTKLILCMGICAGESAIDEGYILAGLPVKLLKDKKELFLAFNIGSKELSEKVKSEDSSGSIFKMGENKVKEGEIVLSYSDYLSVFLYLGLIANGNNIYKRTADVIQMNIAKNPNIDSYKETGFKMVNAKTYFKIDTKVKVKPMMVALPYGVMYGTGELLETDSWNTFEYSTVEGY